jgi:hypothetical protein
MSKTSDGRASPPETAGVLDCPKCAELRVLYADAIALCHAAGLPKHSLLRTPITGPGQLGPCHCPPGVCQAPVIMGRQTPCLARPGQRRDEGSAVSDRPLIWRGDDAFCPECGAEVTTGMMAAFCPKRERCEFWPDDESSAAFLDWMAGRRASQEMF